MGAKRSGVDKRAVFQKGGFGGCSPGTKTGTRIRSHVPPERKPERPWKLKPGFINRVLVAVIFEASECL